MSAHELIWIVCPGLATGLGGLALLLVPRPSQRALSVSPPA